LKSNDLNKNTINKILQLVFSIALIAVLLASCINVAPLTKTTTAGASKSGVLNLEDSGPITLDPAAAYELTSAGYIMQLFSGLVSLDENMQIRPDIATDWDESVDGTTFTFHLNRDAEFHDGKPVTASDFKYSWERALNPETGSMTAPVYLNDIVGALDILSGKTTELRGVTVIDDYTSQVTIDAPKAYFLYKLGYPTAFVVDKVNVTSGSNWWRKPNGTGPFKLKQWQEDQSLTLVRNDNYYGEKAALSQVNYQFYGGNQIQLYQQDEIDVAFVSPAYMGMVTDPGNSISEEFHVFTELSIFYIGFNASAPPFDDVNIRQAFSHAIDKEKVLTLSTQGTVDIANGILPPGMPGFDAKLQGLPFDPQKAKELIAASKYGSVDNLPAIVWTTSGYGNAIGGLIGGIIEEWRRNLGIEVTVRQIESDYYTYYLHQEKDQIYDLGWSADYPDPQDFLYMLFYSGVQNNIGGYSNVELDALLDKAAIEQNIDTRLQMYRQAENVVVQDAPIIPLFFGRNDVLVKPYVKDFVISPLGFPILSKVSIQK